LEAKKISGAREIPFASTSSHCGVGGVNAFELTLGSKLKLVETETTGEAFRGCQIKLGRVGLTSFVGLGIVDEVEAPFDPIASLGISGTRGSRGSFLSVSLGMNGVQVKSVAPVGPC
jgi:hypothetical protein